MMDKKIKATFKNEFCFKGKPNCAECRFFRYKTVTKTMTNKICIKTYEQLNDKDIRNEIGDCCPLIFEVCEAPFADVENFDIWRNEL